MNLLLELVIIQGELDRRGVLARGHLLLADAALTWRRNHRDI